MSDSYDATSKVVRGGSWFVDSSNARASARDPLEPAGRFTGLGFRCVQELR